MKSCTKCGETKPVSEFSKNAGTCDGLRQWCKPCAVAATAKYRAENTAKVKTAKAKWYAANSEKLRARTAEWRAANPDRAKASVAKWRTANPEERKAVDAKWRSANPVKVKGYVAKWQAANREKCKIINAAWRAANPEACRIHRHNRRAREREAGGKLSKGLAERLYGLQRGKCACGCGQRLGDDYHLDHRMPLALGGANEDWNIQLLRATCNRQKNAKHPVDFMQQRGFLV